MNKLNIIKITGTVLLILGIAACSDTKDGATSPENLIGVGPIADAGVDQTVVQGDSIVLDGSGSSDPDAIDPDNNGLTYVWDLGFEQQNGEVIEGRIPSNIPPGTYTVTLHVTDAEGNVAVDTMTITVEAPPPPPPPSPTPPTTNTAPVAKDVRAIPGAVGGCLLSAGGFELDASDADGDTLTYIVVTQPASGTVAIVNGASATYTNTSSCFVPGTDLPLREDTFTYKVNDGMVDSNTATVTLDFNIYDN